MTTALLAAPAVAATLLSWMPGEWHIYACMAGSFLCLSAVAMRCKDPRELAFALVPLAVIVWGAIQIIGQMSVASFSTVGAIATWGSWTALSIAALVILRRDAAHDRFLILFGSLSGIVSIVTLFMPVAERLNISGVVSMAPDYMAGPFPNRNIYACFAELGLPVTLWLALKTKRWVWWAGSAATIASVLASGTRAGAAIILGEAVILAMVSSSRKTMALIAAVSIVTIAGSGTLLLTRLAYQNPLEIRAELVQSSARLAFDRPFTGWGLGGFAEAYPQVALFDVGRTVNHAHNDWLEWMAELGLPGGLMIAGWFAYSLRGVSRHWWAMGVAAVCIHALVDYPMQRQGVAMWVILLMAALAAARHSDALTQLSRVPQATRQ